MDNINFRKFKSAKLPVAYKYTSAKHGLKNLKNGELYFSNPEVFNDIYDSRAKISMEDIKKIAFVGAAYSIVEQAVNESFYRDDKFIKMLLSENKDKKFSYLVDVLNLMPADLSSYIIQRFTPVLCGMHTASNNKIACLSSKNDSLSMWAYYADNYEGVCIEYSLHNDTILYDNCFKVQYSDLKFPFSLSSNEVYYYKSREWEHEQEWRIVADIGDKNTLKTNCITAVYLGCKISQEDRNEFLELAKLQGVSLFESKPSESHYSLEFKKID